MKAFLKKRIENLVKEEISIVPYISSWPKCFEEEAAFLRLKLPVQLIKKIEHFGSTAILGLSAKPIIDILVEVSSLDETKKQIVPILEAEGYEYLWRPEFGDVGPSYYAWFIKRNSNGLRTHHIHMVESSSVLWDRLFFRDYLRLFPDVAKQYSLLKSKLSEQNPHDRVKYTESKSDFILTITKKAKEYFRELGTHIV